MNLNNIYPDNRNKNLHAQLRILIMKLGDHVYFLDVVQDLIDGYIRLDRLNIQVVLKKVFRGYWREIKNKILEEMKNIKVIGKINIVEFDELQHEYKADAENKTKPNVDSE